MAAFIPRRRVDKAPTDSVGFRERLTDDMLDIAVPVPDMPDMADMAEAVVFVLARGGLCPGPDA
jgi:hypothetical protein